MGENNENINLTCTLCRSVFLSVFLFLHLTMYVSVKLSFDKDFFVNWSDRSLPLHICHTSYIVNWCDVPQQAKTICSKCIDHSKKERSTSQLQSIIIYAHIYIHSAHTGYIHMYVPSIDICIVYLLTVYCHIYRFSRVYIDFRTVHLALFLFFLYTIHAHPYPMSLHSRLQCWQKCVFIHNKLHNIHESIANQRGIERKSHRLFL